MISNHSKVTRYKIDIDRYNQTGEIVPITEPEEYTPELTIAAELNPWRNYPKKNETESEEMARGRRPSKEQLEKDREIMLNKEIARKYGVAECTVSFWVKEYGLQLKKNPPKKANLDKGMPEVLGGQFRELLERLDSLEKVLTRITEVLMRRGE